MDVVNLNSIIFIVYNKNDSEGRSWSGSASISKDSLSVSVILYLN